MQFQISETFAAPPERVYHALLDVDRYADWMPNLVRTERLNDGPAGVGMRFREVRKMYGREAGEVFEVRAAEPPHRLRLYVDGSQGASRRGYYDFTYTLAPEGSGTRLTLHAEAGGMGWLGRLLAPLMKGMFVKAVAKDHAALRAHLDGSAAA